MPLYVSPTNHLLVPITHFENALKQGLDLKKTEDKTVRIFHYDTAVPLGHPPFSSHIPHEADLGIGSVSIEGEPDVVPLDEDSNDKPYQLLSSDNGKKDGVTQTITEKRIDTDSENEQREARRPNSK